MDGTAERAPEPAAGRPEEAGAAVGVSADRPLLSYRVEIAVVIAVSGAAFVLGFILEPEGWSAHVLAEVAGISGGAVLAVTLIERVLRRQREAQWHEVREEIERAICGQVVEMATAFYLFTGQAGAFLAVVGRDNVTPRAEVADEIAVVASETENGIDQLVLDSEPDRASSRTLYDDAASSFAPVRDLMTTRVVVLGNEPDLVRRLLQLERQERRWRYWIEAVEQEGAPDRLAWAEAVETLRAGISVYQYFCDVATT